MSRELRVSLLPRLSAVRGLAQMIEDFGDANELPQQRIYMINLAVEELITNTVSYGLVGVRQPKIEVASGSQQWRSGAEHGRQRQTVRSDPRHDPRPVVGC